MYTHTHTHTHTQSLTKHAVTRLDGHSRLSLTHLQAYNIHKVNIYTTYTYTHVHADIWCTHTHTHTHAVRQNTQLQDLMDTHTSPSQRLSTLLHIFVGIWGGSLELVPCKLLNWLFLMMISHCSDLCIDYSVLIKNRWKIVLWNMTFES